MLNRNNFQPQFVVDCSITPRSCLPVGVDKYRLVDITEIQHLWRVYVDPDTGKVHDGAVYAAEAEELARLEGR